MKTTMHQYYFDTSKKKDAEAYNDLSVKLRRKGLKCFSAWGGGSYYQKDRDGLVVELETEHLFENQWNTGPIEGLSSQGLRVFDWAEDYKQYNKYIRCGYHIDLTEEMKKVRRNTLKCGYCGAQEPAGAGIVFCTHCLDSEYLTEKEIYLLRLKAIDDKKPRERLTAEEKKTLLPLFRKAQIEGSTAQGKARLLEQRRKIHNEYTTTTKNALTERDGFLWLLDHGVRIDNVIFYSHTGRFSIGWRKPFSQGEESHLKEFIGEFPFPYDLQREKP